MRASSRVRTRLVGAAGLTQSSAPEETPSRPLLQKSTSAAVIAAQQQQALEDLESMRATTAGRNAETNLQVRSTQQVAPQQTPILWDRLTAR